MVLLTPTMRDRSTPSEATVAPTRTTGAKEAQAPAVTAVVSGEDEAARAALSTARRALRATHP